jgi:hypothetical protein
MLATAPMLLVQKAAEPAPGLVRNTRVTDNPDDAHYLRALEEIRSSEWYQQWVIAETMHRIGAVTANQAAIEFVQRGTMSVDAARHALGIPPGG